MLNQSAVFLHCVFDGAAGLVRSSGVRTGSISMLALDAEEPRLGDGWDLSSALHVEEDESRALTVVVGKIDRHPRGSTQRGLSDGPDGDEVAVLHRPHVVDVEGDKRLSFAGGGYQLNLQTIGLVHLHDGPRSPLRRPCSGRLRSSTTVSRSLYIMLFPPGMQLAFVYPRLRKKGALKRPTGCEVERR